MIKYVNVSTGLSTGLSTEFYGGWWYIRANSYIYPFSLTNILFRSTHARDFFLESVRKSVLYMYLLNKKSVNETHRNRENPAKTGQKKGNPVDKLVDEPVDNRVTAPSFVNEIVDRR